MDQVALGFLLGIVSSGFVWWSTVRLIRPRLMFGDGIRKKAADTRAGYTYSLRMLNRGQRDAVDVETRVTLKYHHPQGTSQFKQLLTLEHYCKRVWRIRGRTAREFLRRRPYGGNRIFQLLPQETEEFLRRNHMPERIREGVRDRTLRLEEIFDLLPGSCIQITVMALDNFSGARRMFVSRELTLADIVEGEWDGAAVKPVVAEPAQGVAKQADRAVNTPCEG